MTRRRKPLTFDNDGNRLSGLNAAGAPAGAQSTADPQIMRVIGDPNAPLPEWVTATRTDNDGTVYWYGPSASALAWGRVNAALETAVNLPQYVADAAENIADFGLGVQKWLPYLLAAGAIFLLFNMTERTR